MEWREQIERWRVKIGQYRIAKFLCSRFWRLHGYCDALVDKALMMKEVRSSKYLTES